MPLADMDAAFGVGKETLGKVELLAAVLLAAFGVLLELKVVDEGPAALTDAALVLPLRLASKMLPVAPWLAVEEPLDG